MLFFSTPTFIAHSSRAEMSAQCALGMQDGDPADQGALSSTGSLWWQREGLHLPAFLPCLAQLWDIVSLQQFPTWSSSWFKKRESGTSLVAQWLRIRLPMQGTQVQALVQEDATCRGATKPVRHNYWACALEPKSHSYWAHVAQLLKPARLEPVLHNKGRDGSEKPAHCNEEKPSPAATRESQHAAADRN